MASSAQPNEEHGEGTREGPEFQSEDSRHHLDDESFTPESSSEISRLTDHLNERFALPTKAVFGPIEYLDTEKMSVEMLADQIDELEELGRSLLDEIRQDNSNTPSFERAFALVSFLYGHASLPHQVSRAGEKPDQMKMLAPHLLTLGSETLGRYGALSKRLNSLATELHKETTDLLTLPTALKLFTTATSSDQSTIRSYVLESAINYFGTVPREDLSEQETETLREFLSWLSDLSEAPPVDFNTARGGDAYFILFGVVIHDLTWLLKTPIAKNTYEKIVNRIERDFAEWEQLDHSENLGGADMGAMAVETLYGLGAVGRDFIIDRLRSGSLLTGHWLIQGATDQELINNREIENSAVALAQRELAQFAENFPSETIYRIPGLSPVYFQIRAQVSERGYSDEFYMNVVIKSFRSGRSSRKYSINT